VRPCAAQPEQLVTAVGEGGRSPSPVPGSIVGLPGWLYYWQSPDRLVRLTGTGTVTVLDAGGQSANVSPDGTSVAFLDENGTVYVADRDGGNRRAVLTGTAGAGYEPVWSPDSKRLLAGRPRSGGEGGVRLGVVDVAAGTFTPLADQPESVIHPLWTADGRHFGYATGICQIGVADADGGNARLVPVFASNDATVNPQMRRSCDPYSISPDGSLMAVHQRTGDEPDGDIGRDLIANAVVDTRTGADVRLPVTGTVNAVLFQPDGTILVRTTGSGGNRLTLLNPDRTVRLSIDEPASVHDAALVADAP
jgi:TolB protein